jgi:uncharacterized protein YggE
MCEPQQPQIIEERVPTIEVSGKATRQQPPKAGVVVVPVSAKGPTQEAAWAKFQEVINGLRTEVAEFGTVGNSMPTESSEEVSRGLRSGIEFTVTDRIEIEFIPANYAAIIHALVACGLPVSAPRFTYEEQSEVTPTLLGEAAAVAKANAEGIALGVQSRLGRLVSINVGPPTRRRVYRPLKEIDWGLTLSSRMQTFDSMSLVEDTLETFNTEVEVTVEYEVVEISTLSEVA